MVCDGIIDPNPLLDPIHPHPCCHSPYPCSTRVPLSLFLANLSGPVGIFCSAGTCRKADLACNAVAKRLYFTLATMTRLFVHGETFTFTFYTSGTRIPPVVLVYRIEPIVWSSKRHGIQHLYQE